MAKKTTGKLYTSGEKKYFYLRYKFEGKETRTRLLDLNGRPITSGKEAQAAADRMLARIHETNKAEQLRTLKNDLQDAEAAAMTATAELLNSKATISDGWKLFMACPKRPASCKRFPVDSIPRHSTPGNYRGYYEHFMEWVKVSYPDARLLSDVDSETASAFMDSIRANSASGTYNKYLQFFNCFFDTLSNAGKITVENPFREIDRTEPRYNSKRPLTVDQIKILIDTATGDMRLLIALGYFTGLRFGDCCTLQWREVDLLRCVIERIPRKTEHTVKDKAQAVVKVGIPSYLLSLISEIPLERRKGYVLPEFAKMYLNGKETYINRALMLHFGKCGIQTHREGTGAKYEYDGKKKVNVGKVRAVVEIGFHSLRYSYISHNAEAGTPAAIIQRNAGHANPAMTEHYTRISDKAAVKYAAALQLPEESTDEVIETTAEVSAPDPERSELQKLAESLSIEQVRNILKNIKNEVNK